MSKKDPVERALNIFPKIYYFVPPLPRTIKVDGRRIQVKDPKDATLWLLQTLAVENRKGICYQIHLQSLIQRWHPGITRQRFSTMLGGLKKAGYINKSIDHLDGRKRKLALTRKGKKVLAAIRSERKKIVETLFQGLGPERQEQLAAQLEVVAKFIWQTMKVDIGNGVKKPARMPPTPQNSSGGRSTKPHPYIS